MRHHITDKSFHLSTCLFQNQDQIYTAILSMFSEKNKNLSLPRVNESSLWAYTQGTACQTSAFLSFQSIWADSEWKVLTSPKWLLGKEIEFNFCYFCHWTSNWYNYYYLSTVASGAQPFCAKICPKICLGPCLWGLFFFNSPSPSFLPVALNKLNYDIF